MTGNLDTGTPVGAPVDIVLVGNLPDPIGGVAEHCYQVCADLAGRGARVHFLDTEPGAHKRLLPLAGYSALTGHYLRGVLIALRRPRLIWAWTRTVRPVARLMGPRHLLRSLVMAERIDATTRRSHASLIVAHHAGDRGLTALVAARHTGTPLTVLVHGSEWTHEALLRYAPKARLVCRSADHVIANSDYTAQLCRKATGRDVVDVINPGVDHAVFTARATGTESDEPVPVVLFVGALHPRKGADVLARAIRLFPADLNARFVFAGPGGSLEPSVRATIQQSGRSDDVSVIGPVSPDALPDLYRAADVLVFPTVWPTEGFGMVAAEAMACAIPVVASRIAAIPEVVLDGQTGLLFAPGDAGDLAQKLVTLLRDRPLRRSLGRQGTIEAARYDWSHLAKALLAHAGY